MTASRSAVTADPASPAGPEEIVAAVGSVDDPEYPGVSIVDLGLLEAVRVEGDRVEIDLVPTFSGCPALGIIAADVEAAVGALAGVGDVAVRFVAAPAWTPERITATARAAVGRDFGVAVQLGPKPPPCPRCGGALREESLFGPTRCRSVHRCSSCGELVETIR